MSSTILVRAAVAARCLCVAWALLLTGQSAMSQSTDPVPAQTRLVSLSTAPQATEYGFSVASAQDLTATLTDLKVPAPLASLSIVVTQGNALVGHATLASPATSASVDLPGAQGSFVVRVFGTPASGTSVGNFTVCIAPKSDPTNCIQADSTAGSIVAHGAANDPTVSTITTTLTVTTPGSYTLNYADLQFPTQLAVAPNVALFQGSQPIGTGIASGTPFNLSAGTYTLVAIAQADQTLKAGLYGITLVGPAGVSPLIDASLPVGNLSAATRRQNSTAGNLTLSVTDFAFPTALASATALVTSGGQKLGASAVPSSSSTFAAPAASLQIWTFAAAGADAGTYEVDLSGTTTFQQAYGVPGAMHQAFGYVTDSLSAGNLSASATDFQFPAALAGLSFAVAQNGVILQQGSAGTNLSFSANNGPLVLLASAQPPASGNGIFGLSVQGGGSQLLFDKAQVVTNGGFVDEQSVTIGTSGDLDVALADLQFPAQFSNLALLVSRGSTVLGKIYGGGVFSVAVQPGTYQMAFVATPATNQQYGLYGVRVSPTPPSVTLTATPTALTSGATTSLSWTTKDAASCTGAGGTFVGSQPTGSGSVSVVVEQSTTYTLTCTGDGGTQTASVTVIATAAPKSSGGGGRLDCASLLLLALLWSVPRTNLSGRLSLKRR